MSDEQKKIARALIVAQSHGGVRGSRRKAWVIDQMVRALTGREYKLWTLRYRVNSDGTYGPPWQEGKAPREQDGICAVIYEASEQKAADA